MLLRSRFAKFHSAESGFTLIEILVSTAIFVVVVSSMLTLFNYALQINRRVQALREVVQGTRAFTETITREVRNGRIDYLSSASECGVGKYTDPQQSLALTTRTGDKLCFYLDNSGSLWLIKQTNSATTRDTVFDSSKFRINPQTFKIFVRPTTDPNPPGASTGPGIQPFVTIVAQFQLLRSDGSTASTINYQTTISTDVYDILHS